MPVSIHRNYRPVFHFPSTGIVPLSYPYQSQSSMISHHGCWRLHSDIRSQLKEDPISAEHLDNQSDPQWTLDPEFTMPPWMPSMFQTQAISNYVFSSTRMTIPLQVISVRRRPFTKSACHTIGPDFQSMSRITEKSCTTLFPCQTCAPQTLQTSQATSDSWEALEFCRATLRRIILRLESYSKGELKGI